MTTLKQNIVQVEEKGRILEGASSEISIAKEWVLPVVWEALTYSLRSTMAQWASGSQNCSHSADLLL